MAKALSTVEILPKISTALVDRRQTTDRQTDERQRIANVNFSSRSLKMWEIAPAVPPKDAKTYIVFSVINATPFRRLILHRFRPFVK